MIRQASAVVVALCLSTSPLYAQTAANTQNTVKLTVNQESATVHKAPSVGSPVIGNAPRGTALVVTREVGDWVKVAWSPAADGVGYVRVNSGTIARGDAANAATAKAAPASTTAKAAAGSKTATAKAAPAVGSSRVDLQACKLEYSIVSPK